MSETDRTSRGAAPPTMVEGLSGPDPTPPPRFASPPDGIPRPIVEFDRGHDASPGRTNEGLYLPVNRILGFATGAPVFALFCFVFGVLGFFAVSRFIELCATIATFGPWGAGMALALVSLCCLAVLGAMGYFLVGYLRLRRNRQVCLRELAEVDERGNLRSISPQARAARIYHFVDTYATGDALRRLPVSETEAREIEAARRKLRGWWTEVEGEEWLRRFVEHFLSELDHVAEARIKRVAGIVAFKTGVSPNSLADSFIVLYWMFQLLGDLFGTSEQLLSS